MLCDHINGNGLDNRRNNLRTCTNAENLQNRPKQKNNTSGFKGVFLNKLTGKWEARIYSRKTRTYIGLYKNKIDAANAYNEKATELFGEFARLNKIPIHEPKPV